MWFHTPTQGINETVSQSLQSARHLDSGHTFFSDNTTFLPIIFNFQRCSLTQFSCPWLQNYWTEHCPFCSISTQRESFLRVCGPHFQRLSLKFISSLHSLHQLLTLVWLIVQNVLHPTAVLLPLISWAFHCLEIVLPWVPIPLLFSRKSTSVLLNLPAHESFGQGTFIIW